MTLVCICNDQRSDRDDQSHSLPKNNNDLHADRMPADGKDVAAIGFKRDGGELQANIRRPLPVSIPNFRNPSGNPPLAVGTEVLNLLQSISANELHEYLPIWEE